MNYITNACPACGGTFEFDSKELGREWNCPHCKFEVLLQPGKTYKIGEITSAVLKQVRASSGQSPASIHRITNDYFDSMTRDGIKVDATCNRKRSIATVERMVKEEIFRAILENRSCFMIHGPTRFRHWQVWSKKLNAILCAIRTTGESVVGLYFIPPKELGLFWEFQSPEAEFVYLPAIFPRDKNGIIVLTDDMRQYGPEIVSFKRTDRSWRPDLFRNKSFFDLYSIKYHFKEAEAVGYKSLLNEVNRGTEDFDNSVYIEEFKPSLLQRLFG